MFKRFVLPIVACVLAAGAWLFAAAAEQQTQREQLMKAYQAGNYKDAYTGYRKLVLDPQADKLQIGQDLNFSLSCLQQLARVEEMDEFREAAIAVHSGNWRLLEAAAESYINYEHYGFMVAGKFYRGNKRGGGKYVSSQQRDRVRALQLMQQALPLAKAEEAQPGGDRAALAQFHFHFAQMLLSGSGFNQTWRLQVLTDLSQLPDYEEGYYGFGGRNQGAPVDADGKPVFYSLPKSYEDARSDGERWRLMLARTETLNPARGAEVQFTFAGFLREQFGVQTLAAYGWQQDAGDDDDEAGQAADNQNKTGTFALHTLGEDETIARLATGIKRFTLPEEFNCIKIYQRIAQGDKSHYGEQSFDTLAQIFEDRRQYIRAAGYWKQGIEQYGQGQQGFRQKRLEQVVGNWGRFEAARVQPAGKGAVVDFRFRNGKQVAFEAFEIDVSKLLNDVKAYLKASPAQLDWNKLNIAELGHRLVQRNETQYLRGRVATWSLDLKPRPEHVDSRVTVTTPLQKPGAYLVTGKIAGGNVSRIIVWVSDTVIVKKQLDGRSYYYVADAVSGLPVAKANVEFFGWKQVQVQPNKNVYRVVTTGFAEFTDIDGQVIPSTTNMPPDHQWMIVARTNGAGDGVGRLAYLGFTNVWYGQYYDHEYNQTKVFTITDRPVYRPQQTVKFKFWVGQAKYDQDDKSSAFANQQFPVQIHNPQGEKVFEKTFTADEYGGLAGEFPLPKNAALGTYALMIVNRGGSSFRVEEYKKPEFEVKVEAPKEPVRLGDKVTARIEARYYFGAPVAKGRLKYKVLRNSYASQWYPPGVWDWFYGRGYWWFAYDYNWYPGWRDWGCKRPIGWWWGMRQTPPEVVAESEVVLGPDGVVSIAIDTAAAKAIHGDQDHQYSITAEVVDESRRTIVGAGNVLVARKPFKVFTWVNRGHYRAGDAVEASFSAQTLDQKPVRGKGELTLFQVTYNDKQEPVEKAVEKWALDTDDQGKARQQFKAGAAGQYRLSYKLTDSQKHTIEGGYVFVVIGDNFDGHEFRFNDIELITDKREYEPGEKVKLLINTNRAGGAVVLFLRPANGVYLPPQVIRLDGKSTIREVAVVKKDMPNFFIEAFTIANSKVFSELREVVVPPEKRVLNVTVLPSQQEYKPGAPATVQVKLTDFEGKPFVGSTVLSMYDKSVEYISGGSNVPEIREFFWKWRRSHYPRTESSLDRWLNNLLRPGEIGMSNLGTFGELAADEPGFGGAGMAPGGGRMKRMALESAAAPAAEPLSAMRKAAPMAAAAADKNAAQDAQPANGAFAREGEELGLPSVQPTIRKNFADTAFWAAAILTDKQGQAEIALTMPENLTGWKVKAWAMGLGTKVGQGEAEVTTKKNLLVRLQAPRFFTQKDEVVLSANVHNYLKTDKKVAVSLELDGGTLAATTSLLQKVTIPAGGEQRVDWRVKVNEEGEAVIRMKALTDEESDAMEMRFPVYVHGMLKMDSFAGVIRPEKESASVKLTVPAERRVSETRLEARYSPTLAGAMVDALPYLVEYPYGCTEQTLNRFLPTVITQNILLRMQLNLKDIRDKRTNLNAQEIGDNKERAKGWKRFDRNPVFDEDEVKQMVKDGLQALTSMQLSDGGWGWFSGYGEQSYPHTTAVVVHGLQIAAKNDVALVPGVLDRGIAWLKDYQSRQVALIKNALTKTNPWKDHADELDAFVYMVLVDADVANNEMFDFLYRDRTKLAVYAKALYGLALVKQKQAERLAMILKNIEQFVVEDDENQTAYLKLPADGYWWYWYGSETEANACYLKLLSQTNPKDERASRLVKYLLNNRKHATYWNSTRDTALAIEALAEYMRASGEDRPDMTVEVYLDGKKHKAVKIDATNLFTFDNKFVLAGDAVDSGMHTLEFRKKGTGPLYFNAYVTNFTLEDFIKKAGLEVKVNRKFYKLNKSDKSIKVAGARGQATDQKVEKYERTELVNLATLKSGDLVEIELEIDSKNDYEYLIFEDMKAAGFEPMEVRSGYNANDLGAYMELRDEKVCFFVRQLARGKHSVSYRMRAEIPGKFSALPTKAYAMYAPELKGNSDEMKLAIED